MHRWRPWLPSCAAGAQEIDKLGWGLERSEGYIQTARKTMEEVQEKVAVVVEKAAFAEDVFDEETFSRIPRVALRGRSRGFAGSRRRRTSGRRARASLPQGRRKVPKPLR